MLIEKWYPKVNYSTEKSIRKKFFFWNGRIIGKQKPSTRALRIHNWQVLSATLGHCYSQYYRWPLNFWLIKLVKEQSLIFCNSKFTACVNLKEH